MILMNPIVPLDLWKLAVCAGVDEIERHGWGAMNIFDVISVSSRPVHADGAFPGDTIWKLCHNVHELIALDAMEAGPTCLRSLMFASQS